MELAIQRKPIQGIDGQDKIHQTIKHKDIGHIAYILSAKLYSDPVLAVVREYICNGTDAHVECGKKDLPVRVHAPTELEPYFSVRDFGKGITFDSGGVSLKNKPLIDGCPTKLCGMPRASRTFENPSCMFLP